MYEFPTYINENIEFFKKLATTKSDRKKYNYLNSATPDQILAIVEICANILKSNFELNLRQRRKLAKYAEYYRSIARSRTQKTARHRIQYGGQAIALASILAPILGSLAQHVLDKTLLKKVDNQIVDLRSKER
jgi:hypothetical protein